MTVDKPSYNHTVALENHQPSLQSTTTVAMVLQTSSLHTQSTESVSAAVNQSKRAHHADNIHHQYTPYQRHGSTSNSKPEMERQQQGFNPRSNFNSILRHGLLNSSNTRLQMNVNMYESGTYHMGASLQSTTFYRRPSWPYVSILKHIS